MPITLQHPDALVNVDELPNRKRQIAVHLSHPSTFMQHPSCETSYPVELIDLILRVKGPGFLCDEIMRDEHPLYVRMHLEKAILGYADESRFAHKRILDFGCGSGASSMILSSLFPTAEIVGIDLMGDLLSIAKARAQHYGFNNVTFLQSPSGAELPEGIGIFDFVVLSAVYEHLLPDERSRSDGACALPPVFFTNRERRVVGVPPKKRHTGRHGFGNHEYLARHREGNGARTDQAGISRSN